MAYAISQSQISMYASCSLKFNFRYVAGIKKAKNGFLHAGIIFHKAAEEINAHREVGITYPVFDPDGGPSLASDLLEWWQSVPEREREGTLEEAFLQTLAMAWKYALYNPKDNLPELAYRRTGKPERMVRIPVYDPKTGEEDYSQQVIGYFDSTAVGTIDDRVVIIDYKTAGKKWNPGKEFVQFQPKMYSYLMKEDVSFIFEIFVKPKIKVPEGVDFTDPNTDWKAVMEAIDFPKIVQDLETQTFRVDVDHGDRMKVYYTVQAMMRGRKEGVFMPCYSMLCDWCDYKKECDEWGRR